MKTGIVLEGGACRGVFTSGVLDVMMERALTFDYCVGQSAGAGNAMNFKSGQASRAYHLTAGVDTLPYYGFAAGKKTGDLIDLDYLYGTLSYDGDRPFDFGAYYANPMVCEYVLTCCETGQAVYLQENVYQKRLLEIVKASCSMPGLCRPREIDGQHYVDGGVADALPVFRALQQGCDKVVLITTKPVLNLHPTDYTKLRPVLAKLYKKKYPALYSALMTRVERYFAQLDKVLELEAQGKLFVLRPKVCHIKTFEKDRQKMQAYYHHGRQIAQEQWELLMTYLDGQPQI